MTSYGQSLVQSSQMLTRRGRVFTERSYFLPLAFIFPLIIGMISHMSGGIPFLTDMAMMSMSALCLAFVIVELFYFPQRFGIGALVLFGGVLVWFTWDYTDNWLGRNTSNIDGNRMNEGVLSRAVMFHCLYVASLALGLMIRLPNRFYKLFTWIPEPKNPSFYFKLVLIMFGMALLPLILNTREPFYEAIYDYATGGRILWKSGRSGTVNYSFGAYWAQLLEIGQMAAVFGMAYAIFLSRSPFQKVVCCLILLYYTGNALFSHERGKTVYLLMPVALFLYFKHQSLASYYMKKFSVRAYVMAGMIVFLVLVVSQFQINYRGKRSVDHITVEKMARIQGNSMFSEAIVGFSQIPGNVGYFYGNFPGEPVLRTLPQAALDFMIGPIPRAIWKNKPVDPIWVWYNQATTGRTARGKGFGGTTISQGAVGYWYIRGGWVSVIQGGLLIGMVVSLVERTISRYRHRLIVLLFCFAMLVFFFRSFRGLNFHNLYPVLIAMVAIYCLIKISNSMFSSRT